MLRHRVSLVASVVSLLSVCGCGGAVTPVGDPSGVSEESSVAPTVSSLDAAPPRGSVPAASGAADSGVLSHRPSADVQRGIRALDAGNLAAAKSAFAAAEASDPKDADAAYFSGVVADRGHDEQGAEVHFRRALSLAPGHAAASGDLSALLTDEGKDADAVVVCRAGIAKHPDRSVLHLNLAVALAKTGDAAGSTREFEAAIKIDGQQPIFFLTYAHWLATWKRTDEAKAKLLAARKLAAGDVGFLAGVAEEQLQAMDADGCVSTMNEAIALQDAGELRTERAGCKTAQKDEPGARADLEAAVKNEPTYAPAHFVLATHLARAGESARAIAEYQAYLKLAPETPNAKVAKERIQVLQTKP